MAFLQPYTLSLTPHPAPVAPLADRSGREEDLLSFIAYQIWTICVIIYHMINGRNTDGKFSDGNAGRPKGSRNKATIAIESLLEGQAEALTQTAIAKALEGDSITLRLCMDRIAPPACYLPPAPDARRYGRLTSRRKRFKRSKRRNHYTHRRDKGYGID